MNNTVTKKFPAHSDAITQCSWAQLITCDSLSSVIKHHSNCLWLCIKILYSQFRILLLTLPIWQLFVRTQVYDHSHMHNEKHKGWWGVSWSVERSEKEIGKERTKFLECLEQGIYCICRFQFHVSLYLHFISNLVSSWHSHW